jgi:hypothetical protein
MIRESVAPVIRAASTNSFSRSEKTIEPAEDREDERQREHAGLEESERDRVQRRPGDDLQRDDEEQVREDHHDLDHPGDHRVDPAAEVAREQAHDHSEPDGAERREQRDLERRLGTVEQTQEQVAAQIAVRAEDVERGRVVTGRAGVRSRRHVRPGAGGNLGEHVHGRQVLRIRPVAEEVRRDRGSDEGREEEEDDEAATCDRELVAAKAYPDAFPVAACLDCFGLNRFRRFRNGDGSWDGGAHEPGESTSKDTRLPPIVRILTHAARES